MSRRRDTRAIHRAAKASGFSVSMTRGNHWKYTLPGGAAVIASATPSDHRNMRNTLALLRRVARNAEGQTR